MSIPSTASAYTPGTTPDFFGVNAAYLRQLAFPNQPDLVARMDADTASMGQAGISWARLTFDQAVEERQGEGMFDWTVPDMMVGALARHGVRAEAMFVGTAPWADDPHMLGGVNNCGTRAYPYNVQAWAGWVGAAAQRYGPNGTFWAAHPELPQLPIRTWEIDNEPNLAIFWCPKASPEQYAQVYNASANSINAADQGAKVIVGGLAPNFNTTKTNDVDPAEFLARMVNFDPSLRTRIPEVGIHPYARTVDGVPDQLSFIAKFRQAMVGAGMPTTPMLANEFGWYTRPQSGNLYATEGQRVDLISGAANTFWRTNCGVSGMAPYSWITAEINQNDPENWFGLANTWTGEPHPSGAAYAQQIQLALGQGSSPPPTSTVAACPTGAPAPDPQPSPGPIGTIGNMLGASAQPVAQASSQTQPASHKKKKRKCRKHRRCHRHHR